MARWRILLKIAFGPKHFSIRGDFIGPLTVPPLSITPLDEAHLWGVAILLAFCGF